MDNKCLFCIGGVSSPSAYEKNAKKTFLQRRHIATQVSSDKDGIWITQQDGNAYLTANTSSHKYADQYYAISYCPMCGRRLDDG